MAKEGRDCYSSRHLGKLGRRCWVWSGTRCSGGSQPGVFHEHKVARVGLEFTRREPNESICAKGHDEGQMESW